MYSKYAVFENVQNWYAVVKGGGGCGVEGVGRMDLGIFEIKIVEGICGKSFFASYCAQMCIGS